MRSFTITIRPDSISGRYISFVAHSPSIIWLLVSALAVVALAVAVFISLFVMPYDKISRISSRASRLRTENTELQQNIDQHKLTLKKFHSKIRLHLAFTEKLNLLFGVEELGFGGYTNEEDNPFDRMVMALMLVQDRYERLDNFEDNLTQLPIWFPLDGRFRLTSGFGTRRSPFTGKIEMHKGLDLAASKGTQILAAGAGVVKTVGRWSDIGDPKYARLGLFVIIEHGNSEYMTTYGHCSKVLVKVGDVIEPGQTIALVGNTGWSTAPHLHFSISHRNRIVDPKFYLLSFDAELIRDAKRAE